MKLPVISSMSIYAIAAVVVVGLIILLSPVGAGIQLFLFGNTCKAGQYYDQSLSMCIPAQTQLSCGAGTYLKYSQTTGYKCELSNFSYMLIITVALVAAYFYLVRKRSEQWRPADKVFRQAWNNRYLKPDPDLPEPRENWVDAWDAMKETHKILPLSAWLFVGNFLNKGTECSALIAGTDDTGWVIDLWRSPYTDRQINILKKQSMKLEQALLTLATEKQRIDAASQTFKKEQEEMV